MKLVVVYTQDESAFAPLTDQRPLPLLLAGGNTLLGHAINLVGESVSELIVVTPNRHEQIVAWLAERYDKLTVHVVTRDNLTPHLQGELLLVDATAVTKPDLDTLPTDTDAVAITDEANRAVTFWFKDGRKAVDHLPSHAPHSSLITHHSSLFSFPITNWDELKYANKRLLGLGYGSEDFVDRSYGEDFTALPPVFLHETAVVDQCVLGPYAHIAADTDIQSSIIRNSIIYPGAQIKNCIVDGAVIGANAIITGQVYGSFIADNEQVEFQD